MHGHADSMGEGEAGAAIEMGACLDEAQQLSPQKQEKNVDLTTTCLHAVHVEDGIEQVTVTGSWYRLLTKDEIGQVYAIPGNRQCADCKRSALGPDGKEAVPSWASTNLCVTLSPQAAGVHRAMGAHVSKVLSLTLDHWAKEQFEHMLEGGNDKVNRLLEQQTAAAKYKPDLHPDACEGGGGYQLSHTFAASMRHMLSRKVAIVPLFRLQRGQNVQ